MSPYWKSWALLSVCKEMMMVYGTVYPLRLQLANEAAARHLDSTPEVR